MGLILSLLGLRLRLFQTSRIRAKRLGLVRPFARQHRLTAQGYARTRQVSTPLVFGASANAADSWLELWGCAMRPSLFHEVSAVGG